MKFTLRQLEYFLALDEMRNFGLAAERCNVSQPGLSVQIKALEEGLGRALFERRSGGLRLTRFGQDMLRHARQVLSAARGLEQAARWQDGLSGVLNIGFIPTVAPYLLPKALPLIRAQAATLELRIREAQTAALFDDLDAGRLDAAVVALPIAQQGYDVAPLFEDRFLLAGTAGRIAELNGQLEPLRPAHIDPGQLLLLDEGHCLADQALEVCNIDRARMQIDLGASSLATLCGLVALGHGYTFLPEIAVLNETAAAPDIVLQRFAAPEPRRCIGLICRSGPGERGWFDALAALLAKAAAQVLSHAQTEWPPCSPG